MYGCPSSAAEGESDVHAVSSEPQAELENKEELYSIWGLKTTTEVVALGQHQAPAAHKAAAVHVMHALSLQWFKRVYTVIELD